MPNPLEGMNPYALSGSLILTVLTTILMFRRGIYRPLRMSVEVTLCSWIMWSLPLLTRFALTSENHWVLNPLVSPDLALLLCTLSSLSVHMFVIVVILCAQMLGRAIGRGIVKHLSPETLGQQIGEGIKDAFQQALAQRNTQPPPESK